MEKPDLLKLSTVEILGLKLKDLSLNLEHPFIKKGINQLYEELELKGISFRPHFWISDEWFSPDGVPGVALPFYLFHSKLQKIEKQMMGQVEGKTYSHFMKLLRHETGHAIDNAYRLRKIQKRVEVFGDSSIPYPSHYIPRPYSKNYVNHLGSGYAQGHPDEDFAETFAVWLDPKSPWQKKYQSWGALKKLNLMNELMEEIQYQRPFLTNSFKIDPIEKNNDTLKEFYQKRRRQMRINKTPTFIPHMEKLFSKNQKKRPLAVNLLKENSQYLLNGVSIKSKTYKYKVKKIINDMVSYLEKEKLELKKSEKQTKIELEKAIISQIKIYEDKNQHRIYM